MSHHQHPPRRIFTAGASRKRKDMEPSGRPYTPANRPFKSVEPDSCNRLLAGYMAHEFLTKGTFLGKKFDPGRAEASPISKPSQSHRAEAEPNQRTKKPHCDERYADVARLLKEDGARVPGIVNPTQLARWIQM